MRLALNLYLCRFSRLVVPNVLIFYIQCEFIYFTKLCHLSNFGKRWKKQFIRRVLPTDLWSVTVVEDLLEVNFGWDQAKLRRVMPFEQLSIDKKNTQVRISCTWPLGLSLIEIHSKIAQRFEWSGAIQSILVDSLVEIESSCHWTFLRPAKSVHHQRGLHDWV